MVHGSDLSSRDRVHGFILSQELSTRSWLRTSNWLKGQDVSQRLVRTQIHGSGCRAQVLQGLSAVVFEHPCIFSLGGPLQKGGKHQAGRVQILNTPVFQNQCIAEYLRRRRGVCCCLLKNGLGIPWPFVKALAVHRNVTTGVQISLGIWEPEIHCLLLRKATTSS